jgi:TolA-binding protein
MGADAAGWIGLGLTALAMVVGCVVYVEKRINGSSGRIYDKMDTQRSKRDEQMDRIREEFAQRVDRETSALNRQVTEGLASVGQRIDTMQDSMVRREDLARVETQTRDMNIKMDNLQQTLTTALLNMAKGKPHV